MSKKWGPNSPMEWEKVKQKASTSAAVSILGFAAMLSAVSCASGGQGQGASQVVTNSDDEFQSQAEEGNESGGEDKNPWSEGNLNNSKVKSSKKEKLKPIFESKRDGANRNEIKIEINMKNRKIHRHNKPT